MDHAREAAIAADLQDVIKKHFPGIRSMVVVKAAYDSIKPVADIVQSVIEKLPQAKHSELDGATSNPALLALPAEVKCRIWRLCLHRDKKKDDERAIFGRLVRVGTSTCASGPRHAPTTLTYSASATKTDAVQPPVTRVCREIRNEALKIFYSKSVFALQLNNVKDTSSPSAEARCYVTKWLHCIGPENSQHLKQVYWSFRKGAFCVHDIDEAEKALEKTGLSKKLLGEMVIQLSIRAGQCQNCVATSNKHGASGSPFGSLW